MPWKEQNAMELRMEFALKAVQETVPFVDLCREYGISPKTGYKWKERFVARGMEGMSELSRRPRSSPTQLSENVVCRIVRIKQAHRTWGPRKIRDVYARHHGGGEVPSESSFKRVLDKAGLVERRVRRPAAQSGAIGVNPAPAQAPNALWTVDFKGWWRTADRLRCEPLTVRDAYSRYVLCATALASTRTDHVRAQFERLFQRHGLPNAIRTDNGSPFANVRSPLRLTRLSAWWVALGIDLERIAPGCPQQNGGHERMHRDIALELQGWMRGNLPEQESALEVWRKSFNDERPHEAIGMRCPGELYVPSTRRYAGTPQSLTYPAGFLERKVHKSGTIRIHRSEIMITTAIQGWNVGLQPVSAQECVVYFGRLCLGRLDLATESFKPADSARPTTEEADDG
jgi:transposase InsO family protein